MLRGVITQINGSPAREVAGEALGSQRRPRRNVFREHPRKHDYHERQMVDPRDYSGQPLISFAEEEALELGLDVGDRITVNILGPRH